MPKYTSKKVGAQRYQKFLCKNPICKQRNRGKPRVWYRYNSSKRLSKDEVRPRKCPACGKEMVCASLQRGVPKGGALFNSAIAERSFSGRVLRSSVVKGNQLLEQQRQSGDGDDDPLGLDMAQEGDDDYAPPAEFNPHMRLTHGMRRSVRVMVFHLQQFMKIFGRVQICASRERAFSSTNQNTIMGAFILGPGRSLSAWRHSGRTDYRTNRYTSAEWCHLVADCLGGPTAPNNLVAASFAANTEMLAIENLLMGQTSFQVMVQAYCATEHVAERIHYHVFCRRGDQWTHTIDARNDHFTLADLEDLQTELKDFLTTHKHC